MKESFFYKKMKLNKVQCRTCAHWCVLDLKEKGKCGVRENIDGKLYSLNYGKIAALNIDPIEKKPFFHFLPKTYSLSLASMGCSLFCKNCQNWTISQGPKTNKEIEGEEISPEKIIETAKKNNVPSISYTYTDPIAFLEYSLNTMKIAKKENLKNCFVSHGFMSPESRKAIVPYLDAINIDIKSFSDDFYKKNCQARLKPILETAKSMKKSNVWVEITTLVIPGLSDSKEMFSSIAKFIQKELGTETPWHISCFSGELSWKLQHLPKTPLKTLEKGYEIGKKEKLKYVYLGNLYDHPAENTYCPKCGTICIKRTGYEIHRYDENKKCPQCKENLNLICL